MTFDKKKSAGFLANHMARLFAIGLHRRIKPLGLAPAQFMTLLELWEESGITQKELGLRLDVEQATMANTISRMERDGLIVRTPHPTDKRAQLIHVTDKANGLKQGALDAARQQNQSAFGCLPADEQKQFLNLMSKVIGNMKDQDSEQQ